MPWRAAEHSHTTISCQFFRSLDLILMSPDAATADDDRYPSASEIAGLKLDADWVILSACDTAAGDATGAQALSGLARAFTYAQAHALLVLHWAVDSRATVKLTTRAMREMMRGLQVLRVVRIARGEVSRSWFCGRRSKTPPVARPN